MKKGRYKKEIIIALSVVVSTSVLCSTGRYADGKKPFYEQGSASGSGCS